MIKAVVFDIGNVLISWRPDEIYNQVFGKERTKEFFDTVPIKTVNQALDRGAPFLRTVQKLAQEYPEWSAEIMAWHDRWAEMVTPEIPQSIRILRALRSKGVPVFALSNFGDETYDIAQARYPFLAEFDRRYISGRLKWIKPEPEIYEIVERDSGLSGDALLFADDLQDNIDAAQSRGWQTHLFQTPQGFADCVVAHGLLTVEEAQ